MKTVHRALLQGSSWVFVVVFPSRTVQAGRWGFDVWQCYQPGRLPSALVFRDYIVGQWHRQGEPEWLTLTTQPLPPTPVSEYSIDQDPGQTKTYSPYIIRVA